MRLLAIDPGNEQSAAVVYDPETGRMIWWKKDLNPLIRDGVLLNPMVLDDVDELAIEMVASYGMAVGATVFETCVWIGRFAETWARRTGRDPLFVYRRDVKLHLCGSARAKDSNIRQALIDRYGPSKEQAVGRKASPGPLYGLSNDGWAALGVAVTTADTRLNERQAA